MASKRSKKLFKKAGRVASVALPAAGAIVAGPLGAGIGTVAGSVARGATQTGSREKKFKAAGKAALVGASITAGSGILTLLSGGGLTTPLFGGDKSLFFPTSSPQVGAQGLEGAVAPDSGEFVADQVGGGTTPKLTAPFDLNSLIGSILQPREASGTGSRGEVGGNGAEGGAINKPRGAGGESLSTIPESTAGVSAVQTVPIWVWIVGGGLVLWAATRSGGKGK